MARTVWTRHLGFPRWLPVVALGTPLLVLQGLDILQLFLFLLAWAVVSLTVRREYLAWIS